MTNVLTDLIQTDFFFDFVFFCVMLVLRKSVDNYFRDRPI